MRRILALVLLIFWSLLMLGGFFVFHKPGQEILIGLPGLDFPGWIPFGLHWLSLARDIAAALGITLASLGLGRVLLGRFHLDGLDGLAVQMALGGGILSLSWLLLSFSGLVTPWIAWGVWGLALVLLRKEIRAGLVQLGIIKDYWFFSGNFERFFFIAAAVLAFNQVWTALSPAVKYDALTYHLAIPDQLVAKGALFYPPANPYWGHPLVAEMLFTWARAMGRIETAVLTGWLFSLAVFLGIAGFSARWHPEEHNPQPISAAVGMTLAALLAAASPRWMSSWGYTDLFSALMGLGGLSCLFAWRESGRRGWILWMGVFAGLAVGTKYTAGVLALLLFFAAWVGPGVNKRPLRSIMLSGLISVLIFAPWAIKNLAFTGNPLFPYALPSADYSQARLAAANLPPVNVDWLALAALPVSYTWRGIDSAPGSGTDLGPLLIWMAIPGLIAYRRSARTRILAAGLMLCWAFIALGGARFDHLQQPRLYFVLLTALGCAAGWGWSAIQRVNAGGVRLRRLIGVLIVLALALILLIDLPRPLASGALPAALGLRSQEVYLLDNTGVYYEAMQALAGLPAAPKILMLWEGRGLYAPQNTAPDPWLDRWRTDIAELGSPGDVLAAWKSDGYTTILLHVDGMNWMRGSDRNLSAQEWQDFDLLLASLPPPKSLSGDHYRLYSIP